MVAIKAFLLTHLFQLVAGPITGVLVFVAHEGLQHASTWLDARGPLFKRVAAWALAALLAPIASALGVAVPAACSAAPVILDDCLAAIGSQSWLAAAIGGAVAIGIHAVVRPQGPRPTP